MGDEQPKSSPVKKVVFAVLLLLVLAVGGLFFLPVKTCPACSGSGALRVVKTIEKSCPWCGGSGKIPFLKDLKNAVPAVGN